MSEHLCAQIIRRGTLRLAIPTYRRFDLLAACVATARAGQVAPDMVVIIDNSSGQCPPVAGAECILGRQPQSVAKAWNDAARDAPGDWLILANDDVTFGFTTIAELLAVGARSPRAAIVSTLPGQAFSLFALRLAAYQAIGPFDEGFQAAYYEDDDYARRIALAGWWCLSVPTDATHVGSATIKRYDAAREVEHHQTFNHNRARYVRKWGGLPGREAYALPWNGGPHA